MILGTSVMTQFLMGFFPGAKTYLVIMWDIVDLFQVFTFKQRVSVGL